MLPPDSTHVLFPLIYYSDKSNAARFAQFSLHLMLFHCANLLKHLATQNSCYVGNNVFLIHPKVCCTLSTVSLFYAGLFRLHALLVMKTIEDGLPQQDWLHTQHPNSSSTPCLRHQSMGRQCTMDMAWIEQYTLWSPCHPWPWRTVSAHILRVQGWPFWIGSCVPVTKELEQHTHAQSAWFTRMLKAIS